LGLNGRSDRLGLYPTWAPSLLAVFARFDSIIIF
jgi:hypothetical protein